MLMVLAGACERAPAPRANDTAAATPSAGGVLVEPPTVNYHGWPVEEAGPVLAVAVGSVETAVVVLPQYTDSTLGEGAPFDVDALQGLEVDLFAPSGFLGRARLRIIPSSPRPGCTGWPVAEIVSDSVLPPWTVALEAGHAIALEIDSLPALSPRDSAKVTADLARVASALPEDPRSPFRGLPFVVRSARRFSPEPGREAIVADVVRRLGIEADPRAEHLLLIVERPTGNPAARYEAVYVERAQGREETVETTELLAALLLGPERRPTLVLSRDYGDGTSYALLERGGDGRWRLRWSSAYAGC